MTKIKICGLQRQEDIGYANTYKPDYIGFVFVKESKRYISKTKALELRKTLLPDIRSVGVFVNEEITRIAELVNDGIISVVQLHGEEDNQYIKQLRNMLSDVDIMKAVRVESEKDIVKSKEIEADYLLYDSYSKTLLGGSGMSFNWELLREVNRPYFLAGGINQKNIRKALTLQPFAIDISSGVETNGYKDERLVAEIMHQVRN